MVQIRHRPPQRRDMARLANIRRCRMRRRLRRRIGDDTVVALETCAGRLRVVDARHRSPNCRPMARLAGIRRRRMGWRFRARGRNGSVVALNARIRCLGVVDACYGFECRRDDVARRAHIGGGRVRGIFSERKRAAMAGLAGRDGRLGVVERKRLRPLIRELGVAQVALVARCQTGEMFSGLTTGVGAVVTRKTVIDERSVVHRRRQPLCRRMTQSAVFGRGHVVRRLEAKSRRRVMTRVAAQGGEVRLAVIHDHEGTFPCRRSRTRALVASLAHVR